MFKQTYTGVTRIPPALIPLVLLCFAYTAESAITATGTVSPVYTGEDPWDIIGSTLSVAQFGTGELLIDQGSRINSNYTHLGFLSNSNGKLTIDGQGSTLNVSDDMRIGRTGHGVVRIDNGGQLNTKNTYLGINNNSSGHISVSGAGSTWHNTSDLAIGNSGPGTLEVYRGGAVHSIHSWVGGSNAQGNAVISGDNSLWDAGNLTVGGAGEGGPGVITVENNATLISRGCFLGYNGGSDGTITVTGPGTVWSNTFDINIGNSGQGTLYILDGGTVQLGGVMTIDPHSTGSGAVSFDNGTLNTIGLLAAGSELRGIGVINTSSLLSDVDLVFDAATGYSPQIILNGLPGQNITINVNATDPSKIGPMGAGVAGTGSLTIADGIAITSDEGALGSRAGSFGTATVTGNGSAWNIPTDVLYVGHRGTGVLQILNAGRVNTRSGWIGAGSSSTGNATISGAGSAWNIADKFVVAETGPGTITIEHGGLVSDKNGVIGNQSGVGVVTVIGAGSAWIHSDSLSVGHSSPGTLNIRDQGYVSSDTGFVGYDKDTTGMVTVTGHGSTWEVTTDLRVGLNGQGTLRIQDGGSVYSRYGRIGAWYVNESSVGEVTVGGSGSLWCNTDMLYVGYSAKGTLVIEDGGMVQVGMGLMIARGGRGHLILSGGTLDLSGKELIAGSSLAEFDFTNGLLIDAGLIDLKQPFTQSGGTLAPGGSIGQTDIIGDYSLTAGTIEIEIGGIDNPHDLVTTTGDVDIAMLGTTIDLKPIGPMSAGTYTIIQSLGGTISGVFENIISNEINRALFDVQYNANAVILTLHQDIVPEPWTFGMLAVATLGACLKR